MLSAAFSDFVNSQWAMVLTEKLNRLCAMLSTMADARLEISPEAFRKELETVKRERSDLRAKDSQLARRQSWLEQGIEYTENDSLGGSKDEKVDEGVLPEMIFQARKTKPTIRQAVALVMIANQSERLWRPAEVIEEMNRRGWLPGAKTARQMVRNRMVSMLEKGELVKREPGGYYQLAPEIRNTGLLKREPDE